ncbi:MAG: hypothetical protein L6Q99_21710 [Planctomycetes bacterium]|nr:hypothetical protein [Planctomycetota bacterium]
MWFILCVAGFLVLGARAQTLDAARFPSVEQVLAESRDDAERYATLKVLSDSARQAGPAGQTLFGAYYNALNDIDFRLRGGDPGSYAAFSERLRERLAAPDFRASVLARFGLGDAAPAAREDGDELDRALRASAPYWIAALIVVLVASPLLVLLLDRRRLPAPASGRDSLPNELRTVHVLGRSYEVEAHSGTVVEKESHVEQRLHVHTTGGGATVVGDQVSVTPTQLHAHTEITRKDCLWVRDAAGRESPWNFTNASLQARAGHRVCALARPAADAKTEFLLAFNRTTGQLDTFDGLSRAHQPRRLLAWFATSVVGAAMVLLAMRAVVDHSGANLNLPTLFQVGNWTAPLIVAGAVAAVTVPISAAVLRGLRTRTFVARHAPAFRKHFETLTGV